MIQIDLVAAPALLAFHHSQSLALPRPMTAIQAWRLVLSRPIPLMSQAFALRDAISQLFGVKRIGGFNSPPEFPPAVGENLGFFLVERAEDHILTLSERDRHLDVLTCITTHDQRLTITSSVVTHNLFGRLYMLPVAPAHRLIVWVMLRRLTRDLARQPA